MYTVRTFKGMEADSMLEEYLNAHVKPHEQKIESVSTTMETNKSNNHVVITLVHRELLPGEK